MGRIPGVPVPRASLHYSDTPRPHPLFGKPDLLGARRRRRVPVKGPIDHFTHSLEPPVRPALSPLTPDGRAGLLFSQTEFHLLIHHNFVVCYA